MPRRPLRRRWAIAGGALVTAAALVGGVAIGYSVWSASPSATTSARNRAPSGLQFGTGTTGTSSTSPAQGAPANASAIAAAVDPGLVDINTVLGYQTAKAAGTGMVLTPTGEVLTNNHVIEGATKISAVDVGNGKTYAATVVGYDRTLDVAVVQLQGASGLQTVTLGNSSSVTVGEAVVGIGNAGGRGGTPRIAPGSVTALNQSITAVDEGDGTTEHLTGLIETNAGIQPGDSGGPLVNAQSRVIGMDTAASSAQGFVFRGAATGQGYAIPINEASSVAKQIEAGNATSTVHIGSTAFLGVEVQPVSGRTSVTGGNRLGFGRTTSPATPSAGVAVSGVIPGMPAQQAGLARGDVITSVGGTSVTSPNALTKVIERYHPGDRVTVRWTTSTGQSRSATVKLASGPAQ